MLTDILKAVSRSFYLTLQILPGRIRSQIGLAYLLARASDTIADTRVAPVADRLRLLRELRQNVVTGEQTNLSTALGQLGSDDAGPALDEPGSAKAAERILLRRIDEALQILQRLEPEDQAIVREVIDTIISGQELDLIRFDSAQGLTALETAAELDDYTFRVAGCVGRFWTQMCQRHLFPRLLLDWPSLYENGIRFGKGLQLVNILRDIPADLRIGRCYVPRELLARHGLTPESLLEKSAAFQPLFQQLTSQARDHLRAGWRYTIALPRRAARLRLACAWPILIGIRTLDQLDAQFSLDPAERVKVSRREVRRLIVRSVFLYPFPKTWEEQVKLT